MHLIDILTVDAPSTGSVLFAYELANELSRRGYDVKITSDRALIRPNSYLVANSLAVLSPDLPATLIIAHEHPWWLTTRLDILNCLAKNESPILCVNSEMANLTAFISKGKIELLSRHYMVQNIQRTVLDPKQESQINILGIGTISLTKGTDLWIEAMHYVSRFRKIQCIWAGPKPDTRFVDEIQADVWRRGLNEKISFVGIHNEITQLYDWANILVISSRAEADCRVLSEIQSTSTSVVAFRSSFSEIRQQEKGVHWVDEFSSHELAKKILNISESLDLQRGTYSIIDIQNAAVKIEQFINGGAG